MDMNINVSMHTRVCTTTDMAIALGTSTDLELNQYDHNGGYVCGHSYEYTYAYVCRLHRP